MATGSGWQQQYYCPTGQGKFNSSTASSFQSGIAMEYTQDLHLKMSKKIAQLTKSLTVLDFMSVDRHHITSCTTRGRPNGSRTALSPLFLRLGVKIK